MSPTSPKDGNAHLWVHEVQVAVQRMQPNATSARIGATTPRRCMQPGPCSCSPQAFRVLVASLELRDERWNQAFVRGSSSDTTRTRQASRSCTSTLKPLWTTTNNSSAPTHRFPGRATGAPPPHRHPAPRLSTTDPCRLRLHSTSRPDAPPMAPGPARKAHRASTDRTGPPPRRR